MGFPKYQPQNSLDSLVNQQLQAFYSNYSKIMEFSLFVKPIACVRVIKGLQYIIGEHSRPYTHFRRQQAVSYIARKQLQH